MTSMKKTLKTKALLILAVWAAVCALFVLAAGSMNAQVIEDDPCMAACYEQKAACVQECGEHPNPIQCDSDCKEQLEDCLDRCPM